MLKLMTGVYDIVLRGDLVIKYLRKTKNYDLILLCVGNNLDYYNAIVNNRFIKKNYNPEKYFRNQNEILYSKIDDAILDNHIKSFFKKVGTTQTRKRNKCHNKTRRV